MSESTVHRVHIAGVKLALRSDLEAQAVNEIVQFVDRSIDDVLRNSQSRSIQNAAIIVALNLAEELNALKTQAKGQLKRIENSVHEVSSELERSMSHFKSLDH